MGYYADFVLKLATHSNRLDGAELFECETLLVHAAMGLAGEAGEFLDLIKKFVFQEHQLSVHDAVNELGDLFFYLTLACESLGVSLDYVVEKNVQKLTLRYPDGFSKDRSINRKES